LYIKIDIPSNVFGKIKCTLVASDCLVQGNSLYLGSRKTLAQNE